MWVCGLKLRCVLVDISITIVAPYVGVWIETSSSLTALLTISGRTLCGCVD